MFRFRTDRMEQIKFISKVHFKQSVVIRRYFIYGYFLRMSFVDSGQFSLCFALHKDSKAGNDTHDRCVLGPAPRSDK